MAETRNTGRIKKYGVCLNDKCEKYKQVQEILHGDLECPECKKKLSPCAPPKKKSNQKLPLIIGGIAIAAAAIGGGIFAFSGGETEEPQKPETTVVGSPIDTGIKEGGDSTGVDSAKVKKEQKEETETKPEEKVKEEEPKTEPTNATSLLPKPKKPSGDGSGSVNMGYGKYTGAVKGGKPHGIGTMRYSSSHLIDSRDPKGRVAEAGDYVTGEWNEGRLVQGRWFGSDGNVKGSIMVGM